MSLKIIPTPTFEKELKKLAKKYPSMKEDYKKLLEYLSQNPQPKKYSIGNGLFKIRLKIESLRKGKSGGARVITAVLAEKQDEAKIYLARIYEKSDKEDLSSKEYQAIKDMYLNNDHT
ncbi:MAG: type II toxin-antitoxin system RelE/ParE family toxin [Cyclobacteriaceae bacterium]